MSEPIPRRQPAAGDRCDPAGRPRAARDRRARPSSAYHAAMAEHHLDEALAAMMELAGAANGYAEGQAPWSLDKAGETERVGPGAGGHGRGVPDHRPPAGAGRARRSARASTSSSASRRRTTSAGPVDRASTRCWRGASGPERLDERSAAPIFPRIEAEARPEPSAHRPSDCPGLVDSHAHLQHERFDADRDAVIERAVEAGIERILRPRLGPRLVGGGARARRAAPGARRRRRRHPSRITPPRWTSRHGRGSRRWSPTRADASGR